MKSDDNALHFFLGANTPQGFVSRFDQLADENDGWRCFVIKGGPGSGKSTMMKRVARHLAEMGEDIEMIHCSSDADSLDGVICPRLKFSIADGTPPHAIEPKYPGAFESVVDITSCWDDDKLYACRDDIISISRNCSKCHEYCCRFMGAAAALVGDTYRIALDCLNTQKLAGYCTRLTEKEFKSAKKMQGNEKIRVFSAVTNKGVVAFDESAKKLCKRIYLINDEYGAVSRVLLQVIRTNALAAGYDIISSYCPLSPFEKLEHIFIPELDVGFMTSNSYHDFNLLIDPYRIVNCRRFTDNDKIKASKKRINFNRKATAQMISQAENLLKEAKKLHDELENYYISATDFSKVEALTEKVIARIDMMAN
ncbi:MAG: hypothetical protein LBV27_05515 [Oscillospiraceae bacterium]|jgi:hypothetical protein|nr:hypothetical protein [Oscillospiraceae bacterium]